MAEKNIGRVVPNYRGDYDASVQYAKLDVVYHDDSKSSYVALADTMGENPYTTPSKWGVVARAKYQVGQQDLEAAVQAVINKSGVHIKGANAALGFSQDANAADTSTIKEVAPGTLSVSGNLNVLGNLNGNANSARALDHDIAINGQNIKTASGASNTLLADPQVTPINAGANLGVAATYPKVNARYSISGKYTNSPDDSITWGHTLDVSSSLNGNLSLTINGPGDRYVASIISGTFSGWTKVVSGDIGGRNYILNSKFSTAVAVPALQQSVDPSFYSNKQVTTSMYIKYDNVKTMVADAGQFKRVVFAVSFRDASGNMRYLDAQKIITTIGESFAGRVSQTIDLSGFDVVSMPTVAVFISNFTADYVEASNPKLELGNVPTDWTPAPEDIDSTYFKNARKLPDEALDFAIIANDTVKYQGIWYTYGTAMANGPSANWTWSTLEVLSGSGKDSGIIRTAGFRINQEYITTVTGGKIVGWKAVADYANVVHKTGNETVSGDKTLTGKLAVSGELDANLTGQVLRLTNPAFSDGWTKANIATLATDVTKNNGVYALNGQVVEGIGTGIWGYMRITPIGNATAGHVEITVTSGVTEITGMDLANRKLYAYVANANFNWQYAIDGRGGQRIYGATTLESINSSSIKTGTVTANGLSMNFREFAAGVEVWFTGTFTGDASYSWHDLGQMPSNITKPFSYVTAVMGGRSGIGGVSTQTDMLLMVHITNTGKIQYQLRHGVENNTTDYKGIVLYVEGSASYFK